MHENTLYSIDAVSTYRESGYRIKPDAKINFELLIENWDEILRFMLTIKMGYSKASTLIRRLNRTGDLVLLEAAPALQGTEGTWPDLQNAVHSPVCGRTRYPKIR